MSKRNDLNQEANLAPSHAAIYLASVVNRATTVWRRNCQETKPVDATAAYPVTDRRVPGHCEKYESEYTVGLESSPLYVMPLDELPRRYPRICFAPVQCASVHAALNLETYETAYEMSGRVV